ncbi:OmpA family protein [bacterium]|nr:OmpA family protein [bacterium]
MVPDRAVTTIRPKILRGNEMMKMIKRQFLIIGMVVFILNIPGAFAEPVALSAKQAIKWQTLDRAAGLSGNFINCICVNEEQVYIGTDKGLNIFNKKSRKLTVISQEHGLPHERILSLMCDGTKIWIGTERGLVLWEQNTLKNIPAGEILNNLKINIIYKNDNNIFLGTNKGLFCFRPGPGSLTSPAALKGRNISGISGNGKELLINFFNQEPEFYNLTTDKTEKIKMESNSLGHKVRAIGSSCDYFWFATDGGGLLGYNKTKKEWQALSQDRGVDKFLSVLAEDGKYIWLGTFYGLFCFNYLEKKWFYLKHGLFTEYDISAITVYDEYIWVGTAGGGVVYGEKSTPYIRTFLLERYFMDEKALIKGIVRGKGTLRTKIEYCNTVYPDIWLTRNANISNHGDEFQAIIDFNNLPDNVYQFKITVWDAEQNFNQEMVTLVKQNAPLALGVNLNVLRAGRNIIKGDYENQTIEKIILYPGRISGTLDRMARTFSGEINLSLEDEQIQVEAFDLSGRSKLFSYKIKVNPEPQLNIAAQKSVFNPGFDVVNFAISQKFIQEMDYWKFQIYSEDEILIREFTASSDLPDSLTWDGQDQLGETVEGGKLWHYSLKVREKDGYEITTPQQALRSNLMLEKQKRGLVIQISSSFLFDSGQAEIKSEYHYLFKDILKIINQYPGCMLLVEGHTDNTPIKTYQYPSNQQLSEARALNVSNYLIKQLSIEKKRTTTLGYGSSRPRASNKTDKGRKKNRRVEIVILKK